FLPLFSNSQAPWRESFLAEYFVEKVGRYYPDWQAVRTERWKYIHYPSLTGMDELYDLESDAREERNLIREPAMASQLNRLRAELTRQLEQTP
ncbi:MAG: DUF4976 domain-containing protein, partial [bacterium]|nr:DUF4976 domain-containing protein [bacterium]